MIITIDGPAGTGKSTVSRIAAERLGFDFLDTGAMYRAIGLEVIRRRAKLDDARELAFIARHCQIDFDWNRHPPGVLLNGEPVDHLLRGSETTDAASFIAVNPAIREQLVCQQQLIGQQRPRLVTEGRDQGTVVFPRAQLKFYLDASPEERARRRVVQLRQRGEIVDYNEVLRGIAARDQRDSKRPVGPLRRAPDAQIVDTTHMTQESVIDLIVQRALSMAPAASGVTSKKPGIRAASK